MNHRTLLALFVFMVAQASVNTVAFAQSSQNRQQSGTVIEFSGTELWEFFEKNNLAEEYDYYFCQEADDPKLCAFVNGFGDQVKRINNAINLPGQNGIQIGNFRNLPENFPILIPDSLFELGSKRQAVPSQNQNLDNLQDALDSGPKKSMQDSISVDTTAAPSAFQKLEDDDAKIAYLRCMQLKQGRIMKRLYDTLQAQREQITSLRNDVDTQKDRMKGIREFLEGQDSDLRDRVEQLEKKVAQIGKAGGLNAKSGGTSPPTKSNGETAHEDEDANSVRPNILEAAKKHWYFAAWTITVILFFYFLVVPREKRKTWHTKIKTLFGSRS